MRPNNKSDLNIEGGSGMPEVPHNVEVFFDAIWASDIAALKEMGRAGLDIEGAERAKEEGAISIAIGHPEDGADPRPLIEALLALGAKINASPADSFTALWTAVIQCRCELVEWMLHRGANINQVLDDHGLLETVLDYAFTDQFLLEGGQSNRDYQKYQQMIDLLRSYGAKTYGELHPDEV